ncbi:hypothetical protein AMATHDRAFT_3009 [Amanita thiersii Skay4041]|uniref:Mei2-like C-terminal RNA recognition motif domain-containing protein n=1 Tax=Amanita thiersii Skay4041 TaxID=703135 RepID=A0A2A9NV35_9AGAR|nr:hypothetical protein AMATHDRAFT_3009 [Amanita thiersii Skay4041]
MSNPASHSRLSIDLGGGKHLVTSRSMRQNPPRLQHSPSLPNIWFPPHSGPIPSGVIDGARHRLQRPTTPPPHMISPSQPKTALHSAIDDSSARLEKPSSATHPSTKCDQRGPPPGKNDKWRRTDPDALHPPLTPPLTPSSSIATRSDSIGTRDTDTQATSYVEESDGENEATRFLLVSNVARYKDYDCLKTAILASLIPARKQQFSNIIQDATALPKAQAPVSGDIIQGIIKCCQESHGTIVVVFYDVRYAKLAKDLLSVRTTGPLAECVDNDLSENGTGIWLCCRFITAEELTKTMGNSAFLPMTESTFYLCVENDNTYHVATGVLNLPENEKRMLEANTASPSQAYSSEDHHEIGGQLRTTNLDILKKYLKTFGDIRCFSPVEKSLTDDMNQTSTFFVEYCDTREGNIAYSELNGQVIFGMKLKVLPCDASNLVQHDAATPGHYFDLLSSNSQENDTVGSLTSPDRERLDQDNAILIGVAGQQSQIRERFLFDGPAGSVNSEMNTHLSHCPSVPMVVPLNRHNEAPSPTYFYTSNNVCTSTTARDMSCHARVADINNGSFTNEPNSSCPIKMDPERIQWQNGDGDTRYWERDFHNGAYHFYYSRTDCYYCPSRGLDSANAHSFNIPASLAPNSPVFYTPAPSNTQQTSMLYPVPQQLPVSYHYESEGSNTQPVVVAQNWGLEHTVMMGAANGSLSNGSGVLGSNEYWYPDVPAFNGSGGYFPQPVYDARGSPLYRKVPIAQRQAATQGPSIYIPTPTAPTSPTRVSAAPSSQAVTGACKESAITPERNQLNLARIEDGQDTRTTVMIKNIPNKMSDKDLINFIHKVCPRRIDFLYLRMDFQNGCNVGYAFVNFIHVQDLLTFAKKKLGVKWNMFSSEKVLQMSYANYQGKEALVEKFKNSCIMDERESWRPKIFYSDGPEQGLPEPFPAPTHLRRKERSSHNRGALYVPGIGSGLQNQLYNHVGPRRQVQLNEEQRQKQRS